MKKIIIMIALVFIFIVIIYVYKSNNQPGDYSDSITWDGLERTYRIHVPPLHNNSANPMPLVIALHGGGGTGKHMEKLTLGGFNTLADREGFVVLYPDGIEKHWNDGRDDVNYRSHREKIDDVGFISALIDRLAGELNIDGNRIYSTGISNGALMSYRLACELPEKVAAVAPVAGAMPLNLSSHCLPLRPIPMLIINGKDDPLVPWEGEESHFGPHKAGRRLTIPDTVEYWVALNNCSPSPAFFLLPDTDPQDGTRVRQEIYSGCREETEVILYAIEGGGHTWPGGYQYLPEILVGKTSKDMDANMVIWAFFKSLESKAKVN